MNVTTSTVGNRDVAHVLTVLVADMFTLLLDNQSERILAAVDSGGSHA